MMKTEKDMEQLTFEGIEQVTLPLHRDCVHVSNRVLGLIAGKEKVLDAMSISVEAWAKKRRVVDLRLISPSIAKGTPFMIIQIEEWWVDVLRRHVRQLIFDGTDVHYVKTVLAAIPSRHAIQRITLKNIDKAISFAPQLRCPQMAFVECGLMLSDIQTLLAVDRPRLHHLLLDGLKVEEKDLKSLITLFIHYFERFITKKKDEDQDVALDEVATLRIDVTCGLAMPEFLLPHNLYVTLNGVLQEMDDPRDDASEEVVEDVLLKKNAKRFRKESSEEEVDEEDEVEKGTVKGKKKDSLDGLLRQWTSSTTEGEVVEESDEGSAEGHSEEDDEGEDRIQVPLMAKKAKKGKGEEEEQEQFAALRQMMGDRVKSLNSSDPFTKALAKAASKSRLVTCSDCKKRMAFRDLASHKRSCKKEG